MQRSPIVERGRSGAARPGACLAPAAVLLALASACDEAPEEPLFERSLLARAPSRSFPQGGFERTKDALVLEPGEAVAWDLELPHGGLVRLGCAGGEGALVELRPRERSRADGALVRRHEPRRLALGSAGADALELPLAPPAEGAVASLLVGCPEESPGPVRVEGLSVSERLARPRPPIVFVSIDTLAAGHMSLHGYGRETTPRIERFAADAVVFEQCLSNSTWTMPSYVAQFSGLATDSSCVEAGTTEGLPEWSTYVLDERRWTLAEALRGAGYRTAGFIDNKFLGAEFGLAQGFELYDAQAQLIPAQEPGGGIRHIVPRALAWLDALDQDEPFFLFVHALDVHSPYTPPEPFAGRFRDDGLGLGDEVAPVQTAQKLFESIPESVARAAVQGEPPRRMPVAPFADAYDEEILDLDDALGAFFEALDRRGVLERAVVVLSADHGESMTEHAYYFNHGRCYQEVVHVPLVVRLPGGRGGGARVGATVQLIDLYPTLLELAGLEPGGLHGRSLVPLLEGGSLPAASVLVSDGVFENRALVHEGWKLVELRPGEGRTASLLTYPPVRGWLGRRFPEAFGGGIPGPNEALRFADEHPGRGPLLRELHEAFRGPTHELYDLRADPSETHDLAGEEPQRLERMLALLRAEEARAAAARLDDAEGAAFEPSESELDELRALGYAGER